MIQIGKIGIESTVEEAHYDLIQKSGYNLSEESKEFLNHPILKKIKNINIYTNEKAKEKMLIVGNKKVALQVFSKKLTYVKYLEWYVLLLKIFYSSGYSKSKVDFPKSEKTIDYISAVDYKHNMSFFIADKIQEDEIQIVLVTISPENFGFNVNNNGYVKKNFIKKDEEISFFDVLSIAGGVAGFASLF